MKNKAFTLVELIVVITILAVLATVAFISFQGYAANSRDSVRLADLQSMQKVNTIFKETKGKYPLPNEATNIVFSGATAWTQGVFGKNSYSDTISMGSVPTDPLTFLPYPYSVTASSQEYQIAAVLENPVSSTISQLTYAGEQLAEVYVKGDYNGQFLKVHTGSLDYLLGVPSILASDINSVDVMDIIDNQRLVYKGYNNLPASYSDSVYNNNGGFAFTPNKVILFEGDIDDFASNPTARLDFLDNIEENYSGTEIASEKQIAEILEIKSGSPSAADKYVADILNNTLKTDITTLNNNVVINNTSDWRNQDINCDLPDVIIGLQTWAGCNSTLGAGFEWGKKDDGSDGVLYPWSNSACFDYDGGYDNSFCTIGAVNMHSSSKEIDYFNIRQPDGMNNNGDTGINNIWGKFYTHNILDTNSDNLINEVDANLVCGEGYHMPSKTECETLLSNLTGIDLGWSGHSSRDKYTSLVEAFQIPLTGYRGTDGTTFYSRGKETNIWCGAEGSSNMKITATNPRVYFYGSSGTYGYSVRCIKN